MTVTRRGEFWSATVGCAFTSSGLAWAVAGYDPFALLHAALGVFLLTAAAVAHRMTTPADG